MWLSISFNIENIEFMSVTELYNTSQSIALLHAIR